ncbi:MAG: ABC transporter substrate-binding protein [Candidatus Limnocylindria bacterium]
MAPRLRPPLRLLLLPLALLLAACFPAASPSPSADASAHPLALTDDSGRSVTLPEAPARIVSLAPSNTEIVCALGACGRLVGVTDFDDYPAEVASVPKVVVATQVDVEKVVAADPQLILAAGNELTPTTVIDQLARLGFPVLVLYPSNLDGLYADVELVSRAIGAEAQSARLLTDLRTREQAVVDRVAAGERPRTFYEVGVFQGTIYTAGADSFLASLISIAGGEPITGDALSTAIQLEALVAADPQLILLGDAAYDPSITPDSVAARAGWEGMTAVIDGRVVTVPEDPVISRPGPRIIDGLEALARAIHPDLPD